MVHIQVCKFTNSYLSPSNNKWTRNNDQRVIPKIAIALANYVDVKTQQKLTCY